MNTIFNITTHFTYRRIATIIWSVIVAIPLIISLCTSGVDCDSAYYICIAERVTEGYKPYIDLRFGYTPLWIYIEAAYKNAISYTQWIVLAVSSAILSF